MDLGDGRRGQRRPVELLEEGVDALGQLGELRGGVDDLGALLGQCGGLGRGAVVDGDVVTGVQQAGDELGTHPAGTDPTDLQI